MSKEIIAFDNIETEKRKFHHRKNLPFKKDVDIDNIQVSSMISAGEKTYKYSIFYMDGNYRIKPLRIMPPKTSAYVKSYHGETK